MMNARVCGRIFYMWGEEMNSITNFNIDKRSVYFQSLINHPEYYNVLQQGYNVIKSQTINLSNNKTNFGHKFDIALKVLEQGILKERETEFQYINQLKNKIPKDDKQLEEYLSKQLESILNPDDFNYTALINFINTILLGQNNYASILKLEKAREEQIKKAYENMLTAFKEEGGAKVKQSHLKKHEKNDPLTRSLEYGANEFERFIEETYLERHSFSNTNFSKYFNDILPTIDYLLSEEINKAATKILSNKQQWNKLEIQSGGTDNLIKTLIPNLVTEISSQIDNIINKAIGTKQIDTITDQLINNLMTNFNSSIENGNKNFLKNSKKIVGIKIGKNGEYEYSNTGIANAILEFKDTILALENSKNNKEYQKGANPIFDILIDNNEQGLKYFHNVLAKIQDYEKELNNETQTEDSIKKALFSMGSTKGNLSRYVGKKIYDKVEKLTGIAKEEARKAINDALNKLSLNISGPDVSELIDTFIQDNINTTTFWTGGVNKKADTITFILSWPKIDSSTMDSLTEQHIIQLAGDLPDTFMKEYIKLLAKKTDYVDTASEFSLRKGRDAFLKASKNMMDNYAKKTSKNPLQPQLLERFAESIKNSIIITETMKTFNQYNPKLGFIAGSMGANTLKQINNFAELFEKAGVPMTQAETEWLEIALVNCSSSAIGYSNKDPIEKYLSALAGFAIFDEGSLEIEMIAQNTVNDIPPTPQIMHLYKLNGLYFPGSYILQRIYDKLITTINTELNTSSNNPINDGVHIRATANETLINHNITNVSARWADVYSKAQNNSVTSIEVTFLSNLFDIINQLSGAFT